MSERMIRQFMEMVQIDSESGNESRMMEYLTKELTSVGAKAELDHYGNLIATLPAKGCRDTEAVLVSCHADTVMPGVGIEPVLHDGVIRSKGETILGADDKAGIAEVLETFRTSDLHPPIEFVVTRQEEVGLLGVKNLDFGMLTARKGFLMDNDTLETIVIGGPSYFAIDVQIEGKSAHAGMEPEKGINAIFAASKAISALRLGRLDQDTTANVGVIKGGLIRNGVPDRVEFLAECRSSNHAKAENLSEEMVAVIRREVESVGATAHIRSDNLCKAVSIEPDSWTVRTAQRALKSLGVEARPVFITGYTDASIFNNHGIEMAVVGIGAQNEHSKDECIAIADMILAQKALQEMLRLAVTEPI